ncbi:MAG: glycerophosphodiester phosphodiesterase family protein [Planctomycetota bacterium]
MFDPQNGIGEFGAAVPGPPWILGHRGSPREAPENTLAGLRRAIDLGLDGIEYDVHGCASGEPVLIHDDTLDRTTDARGVVSLLTLPELAGIDAGGWFHKRFAGEPLPLLEEALDLPGRGPGESPLHMIEVKDPSIVGEVARQIRQLGRPLSVRVASFHRAVCREVRDLGLPAMLLAAEANAEDLAFVRDERIGAYGTAPGGWRTPAGREEWPCERWAWAVDEPADLLEACRRPLNGFNTNQPLRALATRALVRLSPHDGGPYPLSPPELEVETGGGRDAERARGRHGEWSGRWAEEVGVRNPFGFPVEVALTVVVHGGAFDVEGLPARIDLAPGEARSASIVLAGGSWSPGDDPVVLARFAWQRGPGRPRESLILDAPLARVRTLNLGPDVRRLAMLCEHPGQEPASMSLRRRGEELLLWVEAPGGLADVRALVRLDSEVRGGGRGVRLRLPAGWRERGDGFRFCAGFEGRAGSGPHAPRVLRRWAGGLPEGIRAGAPGRLFLRGEA